MEDSGMADYGYITLRDKRQCLTSAGCSTLQSLDTQCQTNREIQIREVICPHVTARLCGDAVCGAER